MHHVQCLHPSSPHLCECNLGHVHTSPKQRSRVYPELHCPHHPLHKRMGASSTDMQQELNWHTLASRRAVSEAVAVYRSASDHSPDYLSALFQSSALTHQHATRSASCRGILVPRVPKIIMLKLSPWPKSAQTDKISPAQRVESGYLPICIGGKRSEPQSL